MVGCSAQQHSAADWQPFLEALVEFPSHREKRHPLNCLFPWQQYQGLPAELVPGADANRRCGICFPPVSGPGFCTSALENTCIKMLCKVQRSEIRCYEREEEAM